MSNSPHPADELAEIRAEIARLRLREGQLRRLLMLAPPELRSGRWFRAEFHETTSRELDPSKLPDAVLQDPSHFTENRRTILHCRANQLSSVLMQGPLFATREQLQ